MGDAIREAAQESLSELRSKIYNELENHPNHKFETMARFNTLVSGIQELLSECKIDLIIMGTKGASNSMSLFMGSNTVNIIKKIKKCPVLIIPNNYEFVVPKQIAFPSDYNRFYDFKELRPLKKMADTEGNFSADKDYNLTMLKDYLIDYHYSIHLLPEYKPISKAIAKFIKEHDIDMLAMVHYEHGIFEAILNEPVIKKFAFHPTVPILVMPE